MTHAPAGHELDAETRKTPGRKVLVGPVDDAPEREAEQVAERLPSGGLLQRSCACGGAPGPDGECEACKARQLALQRTSTGPAAGVAPPIVHEVLASRGEPLDPGSRSFFEERLGADLGSVRVHADGRAAESARAVNARAYTFGSDVVFGASAYAPGSEAGRRLLAHELTHVLQQRAAPAHEARLQRKLGDGDDLTSPRFSKLLDLEAVFDGETTLSAVAGSSGRGVQAVQQALYDLGFVLPTSGADGFFGSETTTALKAFQKANPPLADTGELDKPTMRRLDARFKAPVLPAARSAKWTPACVCSILCPWSPHTVDVLAKKVAVKSFDSIGWADEKWDGSSWVPSPFPGGGYNTGTEIGVKNSSCETMAQTLYHEVLHAEQPTKQTTTLQKEAYAYRIAEEFSIALGISGFSSLRSTDPQGRQFADPAKVTTLVSTRYPSVPSTGAVGDEIIGKGAAAGEVQVQKPDGTIYTRPAAVGEKVPGPITTVNEATIAAADWKCP